MDKIMSRSIVTILCCLLMINITEAKDLKAAIYKLRQAEMVVVANVMKTKESGLEIIVKQVLKGDQLYADKIINIPKCLRLRDDSPVNLFEKKYSKNSIIFLNNGWRKKPCRPISVVYDKSQLLHIKILAQYKSITIEKKRLTQVLKLLPTETYAVKRIVFDEFAGMQNPGNFYLFKKLINKSGSCKNKKSALDAMVNTYDLRAVSYLVKFLTFEECEINLHAARELTYKFAGAKGLAKAFTKQIDHPKIKKVAKKYLFNRYSNPSYIPELKAVTRYSQAHLLLKKGDYSSATELFLSHLDVAHETPCKQKRYSLEMSAINKSLPYLNSQQVDRVYTYINTIDLTDDDVNFRIREILVEVLFQYPRPGNLPMLLELLKASMRDNNTFINTIFLLSKMDREAKNTALQVLEGSYNGGRNQQWVSLIGMYWLGGYDFIDALIQKQGLKGSRKLRASQMKALVALRSISGDVHEFSFLKEAALNPDIIAKWKLFSLVIKELINADKPITADLMQEILKLNFKQTSSTISNAIVELDTEQLQQMIIEMMSSDQQEHRLFATRTLYELKLDESLSYMRKAYALSDYGDQTEAAYRIGLIGEVQDIELLKPTCDYWHQPRKLSSNSCRGIGFLNSKYQYDLNGPIVKSAKQTPFD